MKRKIINEPNLRQKLRPDLLTSDPNQMTQMERLTSGLNIGCTSELDPSDRREEKQNPARD